MESSRRLNLRPPQQDRSRRTLDRIANAALELMEEHGPGGATVAAIVDRAGASVGSFYARFPGKDDLVRYLRERVWSEAREGWDHAVRGTEWSALSLAGVVEVVVSLLLQSYRHDLQRRRLLGMAPVGGKEAVRLVREFQGHVLETIRPLLLSRRDEITHPDPEVGVVLGYWVVVGAIPELLELEEAGEIPADGGRTTGKGDIVDLNRELSRGWTAYLSSGRRDGPPEGVGADDFFDPWGS